MNKYRIIIGKVGDSSFNQTQMIVKSNLGRENLAKEIQNKVNLFNPEQKYKDFKNYVLEKEKEGKIVVAELEGFVEVNLDEIVKQPTAGLLYDLNRSKPLILTFIEDKKWVNDYACALVIEKLKSLLVT